MTLPGGVETGAGARTAAYGLRPDDLHDAYELPFDAPGPQTIAIVDAYDDPTAEEDLGVYDEAFNLPVCTTANHCFRKINQYGNTSPLPRASSDWATEISLDVQISHAICQNCQILLVEAASSSDFDLGTAVETAVTEGATEVSNSYGGPEGGPEYSYDDPGVVITASTGDKGYDNWGGPGEGEAANSPASFPTVVAVGGTSLDMSGESWAGETAWSEGGSGCSTYESAPSWQSSVPDWMQVGCGSRRATADVAADADPYTGVAIYNSTSGFGWETVGGTSLASPIIAATFALAGGSHGVEYPAQTLYGHLGASGLHDVVSGSNWGCSKYNGSGWPECSRAEEEANCSDMAICNAGPGYDGPTGVGTPDGLSAFEVGSSVPSPTVTSVSPSQGPARGGETVTIDGTNLEEALSVRFGNARAAIVSDSQASITVEAPSQGPGPVDVTVTGSQGIRSSTSAADSYEYVVAQPSVTLIEPGEGPSSGGTPVTIQGANLEEAEYVEFGSRYAPVENATASSVRITSPEHEAGSVDVTVVGAFGVRSDASAGDRYTYTPPQPPPTHLLSVETSGSGHGVIFASPPGADCESTCSWALAEGTEVILTAAPLANSAFSGWSGVGCSGTGVCAVQLWNDATVTAAFESTGTTGGGGGMVPGGGEYVPNSGTTTSFAPTPEGNGSVSVHDEGDGVSTYSGCMAAARRALRRAERAAMQARGRARLRALRQARGRRKRQTALCGTRFGRTAQR